jgi:uncharacterized protein
MGIQEKIKEIEHEYARTQKNKATEHHLGLLKAKLAKLRHELVEGPKGTGAKTGDGFEVLKSGDARVALIGFPSVGKSTFLTKVTKTASQAASYEFTTLTCIPGVIEYKGASIQLLDLPGIIEGASQGKGRGRQVIATARTSDLIIMMLEAGKGEIQKRLLTKELEDVGMRLNKQRPHVYFKLKATGGVKFNVIVPLTKCEERTLLEILHMYKIHNCDVVVKEDITAEEFIDVIHASKIKYLRCIYVYNKIDELYMEEVDRLAREPDSMVISCVWNLGLEVLVDKVWDYLGMLRVYTKRRGSRPDFSEPVVLRGGCSVEHVCHTIHRTLKDDFSYALVWGKSSKHMPQRVGLSHVVSDEDVIQIMKK